MSFDAYINNKSLMADAGHFNNTNNNPHLLIIFNINDEKDAELIENYINSPDGIEFLKYLRARSKNEKDAVTKQGINDLLYALQQNGRKVSLLRLGQKILLFRLVNNYNITHTPLEAFLDIITEKDAERFYRILNSAYGNDFMRLLNQNRRDLRDHFVIEHNRDILAMKKHIHPEKHKNNDFDEFIHLFNTYFKNLRNGIKSLNPHEKQKPRGRALKSGAQTPQARVQPQTQKKTKPPQKPTVVLFKEKTPVNDIRFNIIVRENWNIFINHPRIGSGFLIYLRNSKDKKDQKFAEILRQNGRKITGLKPEQQQFVTENINRVLDLFNAYHMDNFSYKTCVELTNEQDIRRFYAILRSKYGDKFLTGLEKKFPRLHAAFANQTEEKNNFKIETMPANLQNFFIWLFNNFIKTGCRYIRIPQNPPPHIKELLTWAKKTDSPKAAAKTNILSGKPVEITDLKFDMVNEETYQTFLNHPVIGEQFIAYINLKAANTADIPRITMREKNEIHDLREILKIIRPNNYAINNLTGKQKKTLFLILNEFHIKNFTYKTYIELPITDDAFRKFYRVFSSDIGINFTKKAELHPLYRIVLIDEFRDKYRNNIQLMYEKNKEYAELLVKMLNQFLLTKFQTVEVEGVNPAVINRLKKTLEAKKIKPKRKIKALPVIKKNIYTSKISFDIIDDKNFDYYIGTAIGTKFLLFLAEKGGKDTKVNKIHSVLTRTAKNFNALSNFQQGYALELFNDFYLSYYKYDLYADQDNIEHILKSDYGKHFLTMLDKSGYSIVRWEYEHLGLDGMGDERRNALFDLLNRYLKTGRKTLKFTGKTPHAIARCGRLSSPELKGLSAKDEELARKEAAKINARPENAFLKKQPYGAVLYDLYQLFLEELKNETIENDIMAWSKHERSICEFSEMDEFVFKAYEEGYMALGLKGDFEPIQQIGGKIIAIDIHTGGLAVLCKDKIVRCGMGKENRSEQDLIILNAVAAQIDKIEMSFFYSFKHTRAYKNAELKLKRIYKEKYNMNIDLEELFFKEMEDIACAALGVHDIPAISEPKTEKEKAQLEFKRKILALAVQRASKEEINLSGGVIRITDSAALVFDLKKENPTFTDFWNYLANARYLKFRFKNTYTFVTIDTTNLCAPPKNPDAKKLIDLVNKAVSEIEGGKTQLDKTLESITQTIVHSGGPERSAVKVGVGAAKGLWDFKKMVFDCMRNPLMAQLFPWNFFSYEGLDGAMEEYQKTLETKDITKIMALFTRDGVMLFFMAFHGFGRFKLAAGEKLILEFFGSSRERIISVNGMKFTERESRLFISSLEDLGLTPERLKTSKITFTLKESGEGFKISVNGAELSQAQVESFLTALIKFKNPEFLPEQKFLEFDIVKTKEGTRFVINGVELTEAESRDIFNYMLATGIKPKNIQLYSNNNVAIITSKGEIVYVGGKNGKPAPKEEKKKDKTPPPPDNPKKPGSAREEKEKPKTDDIKDPVDRAVEEITRRLKDEGLRIPDLANIPADGRLDALNAYFGRCHNLFEAICKLIDRNKKSSTTESFKKLSALKEKFVNEFYIAALEKLVKNNLLTAEECGLLLDQFNGRINGRAPLEIRNDARIKKLLKKIEKKYGIAPQNAVRDKFTLQKAMDALEDFVNAVANPAQLQLAAAGEPAGRTTPKKGAGLHEAPKAPNGPEKTEPLRMDATAGSAGKNGAKDKAIEHYNFCMSFLQGYHTERLAKIKYNTFLLNIAELDIHSKIDLLPKLLHLLELMPANILEGSFDIILNIIKDVPNDISRITDDGKRTELKLHLGKNLNDIYLALITKSPLSSDKCAAWKSLMKFIEECPEDVFRNIFVERNPNFLKVYLKSFIEAQIRAIEPPREVTIESLSKYLEDCKNLDAQIKTLLNAKNIKNLPEDQKQIFHEFEKELTGKYKILLGEIQKLSSSASEAREKTDELLICFFENCPEEILKRLPDEKTSPILDNLAKMFIFDEFNSAKLPEEANLPLIDSYKHKYDKLYYFIAKMLEMENLEGGLKEKLLKHMNQLVNTLYPELLAKTNRLIETAPNEELKMQYTNFFNLIYKETPLEARHAYNKISPENRIKEDSAEADDLQTLRHDICGEWLVTSCAYAKGFLTDRGSNSDFQQLFNSLTSLLEETPKMLEIGAADKSKIPVILKQLSGKADKLTALIDKILTEHELSFSPKQIMQLNAIKTNLKNLKDYSPLNLITIHSNKKVIPLKKFVSDLVRNEYSDITGADISFNLTGISPFCELPANQKFLRFILKNLIDNAIRELKKDPGKKHIITISVETYENSKKIKKIIAQDTGPGIPEPRRDEKGNILINSPEINKESIWLKGKTGNEKEDGSGFGLWRVKQFVNAYGWEISECGEYGKGARFEIELSPGSPVKTESVSQHGKRKIKPPYAPLRSATKQTPSPQPAAAPSASVPIQPASQPARTTPPESKPKEEPAKAENPEKAVPRAEEKPAKDENIETQRGFLEELAELKNSPESKNYKQYIKECLRRLTEILHLMLSDKIKVDKAKIAEVTILLKNLRENHLEEIIENVQKETNAAERARQLSVIKPYVDEAQAQINDVYKVLDFKKDAETIFQINLIKAELDKICGGNNGAPPRSGGGKSGLLQRAADTLADLVEFIKQPSVPPVQTDRGYIIPFMLRNNASAKRGGGATGAPKTPAEKPAEAKHQLIPKEEHNADVLCEYDPRISGKGVNENVNVYETFAKRSKLLAALNNKAVEIEKKSDMQYEGPLSHVSPDHKLTLDPSFTAYLEDIVRKRSDLKNEVDNLLKYIDDYNCLPLAQMTKKMRDIQTDYLKKHQACFKPEDQKFNELIFANTFYENRLELIKILKHLPAGVIDILRKEGWLIILVSDPKSHADELLPNGETGLCHEDLKIIVLDNTTDVRKELALSYKNYLTAGKEQAGNNPTLLGKALEITNLTTFAGHEATHAILSSKNLPRGAKKAVNKLKDYVEKRPYLKQEYINMRKQLHDEQNRYSNFPINEPERKYTITDETFFDEYAAENFAIFLRKYDPNKPLQDQDFSSVYFKNDDMVLKNIMKELYDSLNGKEKPVETAQQAPLPAPATTAPASQPVSSSAPKPTDKNEGQASVSGTKLIPGPVGSEIPVIKQKASGNGSIPEIPPDPHEFGRTNPPGMSHLPGDIRGGEKKPSPFDFLGNLFKKPTPKTKTDAAKEAAKAAGIKLPKNLENMPDALKIIYKENGWDKTAAFYKKLLEVNKEQATPILGKEEICAMEAALIKDAALENAAKKLQPHELHEKYKNYLMQFLEYFSSDVKSAEDAASVLRNAVLADLEKSGLKDSYFDFFAIIIKDLEKADRDLSARFKTALAGTPIKTILCVDADNKLQGPTAQYFIDMSFKDDGESKYNVESAGTLVMVEGSSHLIGVSIGKKRESITHKTTKLTADMIRNADVIFADSDSYRSILTLIDRELEGKDKEKIVLVPDFSNPALMIGYLKARENLRAELLGERNDDADDSTGSKENPRSKLIP